MQAKYGKPAGSAGLKAVGMELSREARVRLSWMDFYRETKNVALSCRRFEILRQLRNQISPATLISTKGMKVAPIYWTSTKD